MSEEYGGVTRMDRVRNEDVQRKNSVRRELGG